MRGLGRSSPRWGSGWVGTVHNARGSCRRPCIWRYADHQPAAASWRRGTAHPRRKHCKPGAAQVSGCWLTRGARGALVGSVPAQSPHATITTDACKHARPCSGAWLACSAIKDLHRAAAEELGVDAETREEVEMLLTQLQQLLVGISIMQVGASKWGLCRAGCQQAGCRSECKGCQSSTAQRCWVKLGAALRSDCRATFAHWPPSTCVHTPAGPDAPRQGLSGLLWRAPIHPSLCCLPQRPGRGGAAVRCL